MSGNRGSEFGEMQPKNLQGIAQAISFQTIPALSIGDLDTAEITPLVGMIGPTAAPRGAFRPGQQILFRWGVANPNVAGNWLTYVQFKLWWLVETLEKRAPGMYPAAGDLPPQSGWKGVDLATFGAGPIGGTGGLLNNRYCWVPGPKRLDLTQFMTAGPGAPIPSPPRTSDSLLLDDLITMEMPDPSNAAFLANFSTDQLPARWDTFFYPSYGYGLGVTAAILTHVPNTPVPLQLSVQWSVGTLGGTLYQESVG